MTHPNAEEPREGSPTAKNIFGDALELPLADRAAFVAQACGGDSALRAKVEELLRVHEGDGPFLRSPTADNIAESEPTHSAAAVMPERTSDPVIGARIGPYKLLERIDEGGFGAVYMAEQREPLFRKVALKLIKPGMDSRQVIARFEAERQALALMDHPHIARVFDGGVTDASLGARPYFVMEYVRGEPITAFADAHRLRLRDRLDLFTQVCQAVQHAHTKAVIHRDIKPRNVLVSMVDGRPFAKVIDFGIAKATGSPLTDKTLFTEHRQLIGTPEYMSPEQAEGSPDLDTRTDVYALGVLLYELLTGATPFDAKRLRSAAFAEMQRIIKEEEPPLPSVRLSRSLATSVGVAAARQTEPGALGALVKGELDWIAMKALDKDRARRYEGANALAADVQRHLSGEPVLAAPPSVGYRVRKFVRRNRGPVLATMAVVSALSIGIVGMSIGFWTARQQRDLAFAAERVAVVANEETERQRAAAEQSAYVANIATAAMALDRVDTSELITRLDACPEGLRGFEWRLLKALSDQADVVLRGHSAVTWIVRFHPSGEQIATGSQDGTVRLWDASTGDCRFVLKDLRSTVHSVDYSDDGERVAAGAENGRVCVWNSGTGVLVSELRGHTVGPVGSVAFAPCSRRLVTTATDATTRLWDGDTGEELWMLQHSTPAKRAVFSPDGDLVLTTCDDEARFWEALSGEPRAPLEGVSGLLETPSFRPDGAYVIGTYNGNRVGMWDTVNGARFDERAFFHFGKFLHDGRYLHANPGNVFVQTGTGEAWSRFGWEDTLHPIAVHSSPRLRIATGSSDDSTRIWDAEHDTGLLRTLIGHTGQVVQICFSPNGSHVATAAWDNEPRIWSVAADTGVEPDDGDGESSTWPPAQTRDGSFLASPYGSGLVRIWNSKSGEVVKVLRGHVGRAFFAEFSHDDRKLLTVADDATVRVWDVASGREVNLLSEHEGVMRGRFSPDDSLVLSLSENGTARIWTLASGQYVELKGHDAELWDGAFAPDGRRAVTASKDNSARIWDVQTGALLAVLSGHREGVRVACYSPDGNMITTGAADGSVRLWDAHSGRQLRAWLGSFGAVSTLTFLPDSRRILATSYSGIARLWDIENDAELVTLSGHRDSVSCADLSPDESRIVTGSYDGTVRFWDPTSGTCLLTLRVDRYRVGTVAFHPDGTRLFTIGASQGSRIWDCTPRRVRN